jgi:hypothetical protein
VREASEGAPRRRGLLTLGLVLGVTVMAFAGLAVVTIAPRIPADLGGLELYGWVFSGYLLASLFGTVWGGQAADRSGPGRPFALGLAAFVAGLVLAVVAPSMPVLVVARVLQGLGGGAIITCIYVALSLAYRDADRPRVLAYLSSAWVVPALVGPALAGAVAEIASWRWVFVALVPIALVVAFLTVPTFARLPAPTASRSDGRRRLLVAGALALAVGLGLWALSGPGPALVRVLAGLVAVTSGPLALARLTPARTLRLGPGLGAIVPARGLAFGAFIAVEVYLALMLTDVLQYSSAVTGIVIAVGAISWSGGAWSQARLEAQRDRPARGRWGGVRHALATRRHLRVLVGASVLAMGLLTQAAALTLAAVSTQGALLLSLAGWLAAGAGMGLAHSTSTALAFARAEAEGVEAGSVSSALLLGDNVAAATATGVGGALLALSSAAGWSLADGVLLGFAAGYGSMAIALVAAARIGPAPSAGAVAAPAALQ